VCHSAHRDARRNTDARSGENPLDTVSFPELVSPVTLDFRILGPLEVEGDAGPVALGGQRQRALLAVLLLHAGRVVATDRLVHELWGERPPSTASASLQNAVSQLRKVIGAETLQTRAPGYMLAVESGDIDAGRFEAALVAARRAAPTERARLLRQALAMWRGPPLAEFTFESFAQSEIHRLEELRLAAIEQRIDADIESGSPGEVIAELEALVVAHPLRESYWKLLMLALYRSGRQAEALDAYQSARSRLVEDLGIEPSEELRRLHGSILRQDAGLAGGNGGETDVDAEILKALLAGSVVPVLGLDGAGELAEHLAAAFGVPDDRPVDLARVSQYVATMQGSGPLYDELHSRFEAALEPGPLHRFLARLPALLREHGAPHQLIVTTNYDLALERAFEEAGEEVDVVAYVASGPNRGHFWHRPPADAPRPIEVPNTYATELSLERRTILLKLHGAVDPLPEREWESFVITEDDYIDYLGRSELTAVVPVALAAKLRRSHFLFLGYEMADWNLRLILNRIWGERPVAYRSWSVQRSPSPLAHAFWRRYDVETLDVDPQAYVELLERRLEAA
jgi:DNA-binding SARP family transcriptional activator